MSVAGALRKWARGHTERSRYSPVGIAFHWVMALLVLFQLGWGYYSSWLPAGGDKLLAYQVHSAAGLPILLLALARFGWRLLIPGPINDADRQGWQTQAAYAIHYVFYIAFFGLPLSGWVMWSSIAEPGPLYLAGVVPWPQLPFDQLPLTTRWRIMDLAEDVHLVLVITLLVVIPLHVGAALKHHFWDRHDVLRGMLPEIPDAEDPRGEAKHKPREPRLPSETAPG
ncbi:cytochrome b [Sphingomonas koreensis]|jgi:cytochrome b561|uniref:Cytochrome B n=1 Tax=Sphingomonas koreensis TaxID=93064 RepID=A0A1L6JD66_9SPHN|nr:cytochrome b [Sphingomonas koreensis]APR53876.1 cytochrome B [Sphingomonas koreensis]MDC7808758.1 cytochrome b [Sphingomonas koreensis]